ncbi:hypothetical protein NUW58_g9629 [Xylaria curta]|uniref:Uncharacterized protein n=1 Tax=Xylaria curta TaxID=42375 RepID=A0ACC1MVI0_9PEZI|nr:hypothetical protein NUW58_g9629 [Xylaria curta]
MPGANVVPLASANGKREPVDALEQPHVALVGGEPLAALHGLFALGACVALLVGLAQAKEMRDNLGRNTRLCAQARDGNERRSHSGR